MEELIEAKLQTGAARTHWSSVGLAALEIGEFYVVEMHGTGQPEMWWLYDEDYEPIILGSESVRAEWKRKYGEDFPSHFNNLQEAIDEAVVRIKSECKRQARAAVMAGTEPLS